MSKNSIDPKKFFDKKNYNTLIIGTDDEGKSAKNSDKTNFIDLLTNENNKDIKEDVLKILKKDGGAEALINAITRLKAHPKKHLLVAAFWEANIDCKNHLSFFVDLALNDTYEVCLEALTVIEEMQGPFGEKEIKDNINKSVVWLSQNGTSEKKILIENLKLFLENF